MSLYTKGQRLLRREYNRARWRLIGSKLPAAPDGRRLIHVGCGGVDAPGYINVDARPMPHVHFRLNNLRDLSFLPPDSVDLVYMCHVLEHVPVAEVPKVLKVIHTSLRSDGVVRISVPDFDAMLDIYRKNNNDIRSIQGPLMGGQDYDHNFHFAAFTEAYLRLLLDESGFVNAQTWTPEQVDHHDFVDWSGRQVAYQGQHYPISLNLQAFKR